MAEKAGIRGVDAQGKEAKVKEEKLQERVRRVEATRKKKKYFPPSTHFKCNMCKDLALLEDQVKIRVEINTGSGNPNSKEDLHTYGTFMQICKGCNLDIEEQHKRVTAKMTKNVGPAKK